MKKLLFLLLFLLPACAMKHHHLGAVVQEPHLTGEAFHTSDGKTLKLSVWRPQQEPLAVIAALHGMNDYRKAFELPGQYLSENGFLVLAYDQRGFGENKGAGYWAEKEALKADVVEFLGLVREKYPQKDLFLLGESMGGALALYALAGKDKAADGVILVAPAVWGWRPVNIVYRPALWLAARILPWKKFSGKNLELKPSDNEGLMRAMSRDPYVIKKTRLDAIYGLSRLMKWGMKSAPQIRAPVFLLYGEEEHLVPDKNLQKLWEKLPRDLKSRKIYHHGYHLLLRGCAAGQTWQDIAGFIVRQADLNLEPGPAPENLCQPNSTNPEGQ